MYLSKRRIKCELFRQVRIGQRRRICHWPHTTFSTTLQ